MMKKKKMGKKSGFMMMGPQILHKKVHGSGAERNTLSGFDGNLAF